MDKPEIETAISQIMAGNGLTRGYRIRRLKDHIDHPDPIVSLRGLDLSFKLDGSYAPDKHLVGKFSLTKIVQSIDPIKERTEDEG